MPGLEREYCEFRFVPVLTSVYASQHPLSPSRTSQLRRGSITLTIKAAQSDHNMNGPTLLPGEGAREDIR